MPMNDMQSLAAYEKFDKNVLVSAGAGSGKTQVLTTRVYDIIASGISPLNILVLTFTNAAAFEMKDRVRQNLSKDPKMSETLPLLEQAYITTFDSFNLSICKKYYYALNISPNLSICDSTTIRPKKIEIIQNILDSLYKVNDPLLEEYLDKFTTKKDDTLVKHLLKLIDSLDKKEDTIDFLNNYFDSFFIDSFYEKIKDEYLTSLSKLFNEYALLLIDLEGAYSKVENQNIVHEIRLKCDKKSYDVYKEIRTLTLPKKTKNDSEDISEIKEKIKDLLKEIDKYLKYDKLDDVIEEYKESKNTITLFKNILTKYYKEITAFSLEFNMFEFNDVQKMAISLVKNNKAIRDEIKSNFKTIMIDEYQDTSDLQEAFISYIENDNLFMVGDIKQSIYRFRNANPNIFKWKYENYTRIDKNNYSTIKQNSQNITGYLIDMNQNFRSRREVLDDINNMFSMLMTSEVGDAAYRESHLMQFGLSTYDENKANDEKGFTSDFITYPYDKKNSKVKRAYYEAYIIAQDIKKKLGNYVVYNKDLKGFRKATLDDFCIINDRQNNFKIIKQVLEYYQIPTVIYADKSITDSYVTMTLVNTIKLISKYNKYELDSDYYHALASILRSFLFKFNDNQIYDIIALKHKNEKLEEIISNLSQKIDVISNGDLYKEILKEFNFYEKLPRVGNINEALHEAEFIYNKINDLSALGYSFSDLASYLGDLVSTNEEVKYSLDVSQSHGVKMMNIHKSKGLEFPICYFSDLNHKYNSDNIKSTVGFDKEYGIFTPIDKEGIKDTVLKMLVENKFHKETISERLRLFYVALTRAREKMIFIRDEENISQKVIPSKHKSFGQYFDYILDNNPNIFKEEINLSEEYFEKMLATDYDSSSKDIRLSNGKALVYNTKELVKKEDIKETHISKSMNKLISKDLKNMLDKGTYYHEILELLDFSNLEGSLNALNLESKDYSLMKKVITLDIFKNVGSAHTYHEHEYKTTIDNNKYHGIIDLLVEYDDHFDIIDYKLKNYDDEAYDRQLSIYYNYVKTITNKPVNCYLLSIVDAKVRKVDVL